jgi:hypothetical protein
MTKCMVLFAGLLLYQYHNLFINQDSMHFVHTQITENNIPSPHLMKMVGV